MYVCKYACQYLNVFMYACIQWRKAVSSIEGMAFRRLWCMSSGWSPGGGTLTAGCEKSTKNKC